MGIQSNRLAGIASHSPAGAGCRRKSTWTSGACSAERGGASFSTTSECLTPGELVEFINEYLTEMCDIIAQHGG